MVHFSGGRSVCRPVQREIDNQKNRGNDRVGKRARAVNATFKEIIVSNDGYKLIRDAGPQVKLLIEPGWRPSPELAEALDYSKVDDEVVGCLQAFLSENPNADARLFTHDSGPMGTAKMLSLPFEPVPDDWLVPPESNDEERKIRRLEGEVSRLKKSEPEFRIASIDEQGQEIQSLEFTHEIYQPLSDQEVAEIIASVKQYFPIATDFGSRQATQRSIGLALATFHDQESFEPATDEEIKKYKEELYPKWLERCEGFLRDLHFHLQHECGQPEFEFSVENVGTRPGKDVFITFTAMGGILICPPPYTGKDQDDEEQSEKERKVAFPRPPKPPRGTWTVKRYDPFRSLGIMDPLRNSDYLRSPAFDLPSLIPTNFQRDPNGFYYKPERPHVPVDSFGLECEQWRHSVADEIFTGLIYFGDDGNTVSGAIECTVHAENLSEPSKKTIPVRVTLTKATVKDRADALLKELVLGTDRQG